jgi:hypothetical protein
MSLSYKYVLRLFPCCSFRSGTTSVYNSSFIRKAYRINLACR